MWQCWRWRYLRKHHSIPPATPTPQLSWSLARELAPPLPPSHLPYPYLAVLLRALPHCTYTLRSIRCRFSPPLHLRQVTLTKHATALGYPKWVSCSIPSPCWLWSSAQVYSLAVVQPAPTNILSSVCNPRPLDPPRPHPRSLHPLRTPSTKLPRRCRSWSPQRRF